MRCSISVPACFASVLKRVCGVAIVVAGFFFGCASTSAAQDKQTLSQPATAAAAAKPADFSKEALVLNKLVTSIREEADGTGSRQTTASVRILADAGVKEMAVLAFTYTASNQVIDIGYVRVIKPDGSVVKTPDYNVQDLPADVTRAAPMYSDIHQKHVAVKGLGVGDTLEYQVTLRILKPEVPGHFWFDYSFEKNLIMLDEQLDLDVPAEKAVTVASDDVQPTISTAAGRKLYHWSSANLARPDPDAPPKSTKHLKPSVQVTTFASWEQVGAWYQSLQSEPLVVTPAIQAKVDALTKGLTTNSEKVQAIFNDVALHIHYVGLEFGIGRYQPHPADDVLSNEYGDCKDKHTLLASELKAAGIQAWPVLISSDRELDPATPSPAQFNHVITLVPLDGKLLWMDSTEEVAPIGVLMGMLRNKQGLAIPDGKPAYLEKTPANLPIPRTVRIEADGKLSATGQFTGHISQTADGDIGALFRAGFRRVPESQWKELMEQISQAEGYAGEVSNPQVSEVEKISQPFQFSFDYTREKYYQWNDKDTSHWVSPPLPAMGGELAPGAKEKKPADDPDLGYAGKTLYHSTLQLPKGWSMTAPPDADLKEDWLEYHAKYSFKEGIFTADRVAEVKEAEVPLEQWEKYLALRRAMFEDWNRQVLIAPFEQAQGQGWPGSGAGTSASILIEMTEQRQKLMAAVKPYRDALSFLEADPPPSGPDLGKVVSQCRQMVSDTEAASAELPPGDPHSLYWSQVLTGAWTCLGWAELEAKQLDVAETYLRSAWALSQGATSGYQLARLLEAKGNKSEAAHLYELASITGVDPPLAGTLGSRSDLTLHIAESYKHLTGKELTATPYKKNGFYDGGLRSELDKQIEVHPIVKATKLTGSAYFMAAFEAGKPTKVQLIAGDKSLASLVPTLQAHVFPPVLPPGSKARLMREIRVICTPWAGCDADLLLPTSIQTSFPTVVNVTKPGDSSAGPKLVPMQPQH